MPLQTGNFTGEEISATARALRKEYQKRALDAADVDGDPFKQFRVWFDQAVRSEIVEPNAMTLATATRAGVPGARTVLLKELTAEGFQFFTNYGSRKGGEIAENSRVALLFYWEALERQVRIDGRAEKLSRAESSAYFSQRPRSAQLGAWASEQSRPVAGRAELEQRYREAESRFDGKEVPCPEHWGGYLVRPELFEFWQGRPSRLHDRIEYTLSAGAWSIKRLSP